MRPTYLSAILVFGLLTTSACELNIRTSQFQTSPGDRDGTDGPGPTTDTEKTQDIPPVADTSFDTQGDASSYIPGDDAYPCKGTKFEDEVPKEECQGDARWDRFEGKPKLVERGKYLVENVALCIDCHSTEYEEDPSAGVGERPNALAGLDTYHPRWGQYAPKDPLHGGVKAANLRPHPTGLGEWTPKQVRDAFTKGIRPEFASDYPVMLPAMPYWSFANMSKRDQDAILAFLHSIKPIEKSVTNQRQAQADDSPYRLYDKASPEDIDDDGELEGIRPIKMKEHMPGITLPENHKNYDRAKRGRYLTTISSCAWCHSKRKAPNKDWEPQELLRKQRSGMDLQTLHAGGRIWKAEDVEGVDTSKGWPREIMSQNITGHDEHGVGDWAASTLARGIRLGLEKDGVKQCPPMPAGTQSLFSDLTEKDAMDMAYYLKYSEPNGSIKTDLEKNDCRAPTR